MLTSLPVGGPDGVPVTDPPGALLISGASGIEITVKAAEGTVIGVPYYWQDGVWQPLLGDATVAPRQVKAIAAGVDIGHLAFNKPATPLWFAVLETGGGTVSFCDIREADGTATLGLQEVSGAGGGGGGGDATAANQVIGNASLASIDGKLTAPLSVTGPLTDTQLRASAVSVTGPLTDAQLRATPVPVSGPLTDTQLRASAVPVSAASLPLPTGAATEVTLAAAAASLSSLDGKLANPMPVSAASLPLPAGAATSANQATEIASLASIDSKLTSPLSVTGPLTDAQLRATAVPVSGPLTDAQLRASAVPVSAASLPLPTGAATAANQTNGTQLAQVSNGTNSAGVLNTAPVGTEYGLLVRTLGSTSAVITSIPYSGLTAALVPVQAAYVGGADSNGLLRGFASNADNDANPSAGKMVTMPAVTKNTAPTWQNNKVVPLWVDTSSALLMTSAAQGAAAATASAWPIKITDGTSTSAVKAASTAAAATDPALVVAVRPTVTQPSTSTKTTFTGISSSTSLQVFASTPAAKGRKIYNSGTVVVYISEGSGAHTGQSTASYEIAPGATWVMPIRFDGAPDWTGEVRAIVGGSTNGSLVTTEIT